MLNTRKFFPGFFDTGKFFGTFQQNIQLILLKFNFAVNGGETTFLFAGKSFNLSEKMRILKKMTPVALLSLKMKIFVCFGD